MLRCNITLVEKKNSAVKWKDGSTQTAKWLDRNSRKIETHRGGKIDPPKHTNPADKSTAL